MGYFTALHVNLRPPATEALDYLIAKKSEMSKTEIVSLLIIREAAEMQLKEEQETDSDVQD